MEVNLVSHINADGDLLTAWFEYYTKLGITAFHLIVHGPHEENTRLFELIDSYPVFIKEIYQGEFTIEGKEKRINSLLSTLRGSWVLFVDSDEFLELPYRQLNTTIRKLKPLDANALYAPMLQRITSDGSLETPKTIDDPFVYFPRCSVVLNRKMGVGAADAKYPLFFCCDQTFVNEGNHYSPNGTSTTLSHIQGVTHHFKWRKPVLERLTKRAHSTHPFRRESVGHLKYLENNDYRLPTDDSFYYSRTELFRQGFLRSETARNGVDSVDAYAHKNWWGRIFLAIQEIAALIPAKETFILVDEDHFVFDFFDKRNYIPLIDHDNSDSGRSADDESLIREFKRLQRVGATFIVFGFPAFWWLDYYSGFHEYLKSRYTCILKNDRLVIFDLIK
ncbi:MAG: glycosyltransferase family 2 protein [Thermodesulfobacteriota bacterium]